MNPFDAIANFLTNQVVVGLLKIATPIAIIALIVCCLGTWTASDEQAKSAFKRWIWFFGFVAIVCFSAPGIMNWLSTAF
jgi:type IV secretory pathway VirB2 component (pilin)